LPTSPETAFDEQVALLEISVWSMLAVIVDRPPTPRELLLRIRADRRGVFAEGEQLVERDRIRDGYVREAREAQLVFARYYREAQPLSVELTTDRRIWAFKVRDMEQATRLLFALGLAVRVVEPGYTTPVVVRRDQRFRWKVFAVFALIVFAITALAYLLK
jgi:hypothetical protein